jgi:hypothetical protein
MKSPFRRNRDLVVPRVGGCVGSRRRHRLARAAALAFAAAASALALERNEWKNQQSLAVEVPGVIKFALPPATLDLARPGLEDLRLLDAEGRETPFLVDAGTPVVARAPRAPRSVRTTLAGNTTQLLIETGESAPLAGFTLATPAPAFLKSMRIESSDDGERWDTIEAGAPFFRQFGAERIFFPVPPRTAAITHLRLTLDDARSAPIPISGITLTFAPTAAPRPTLPLPVRLAGREEFSGETVLTLDLGARNVPLAELEFATPDALFARQVTVAVREAQDGSAVERTLARGTIFRVAVDGLAPTAQLRLPVDFTVNSRELLVHIANGDSPPLAVADVRVLQRPVYLVFRAVAAGAFTLLTGNPDAVAPRYDLATLGTSLRDAAVSALTVGPAELNPGYRRADALATTPLLGAALDPAPWNFRKNVRLVAGGVQQLELDVDVLAHAQRTLGDLRLVRDRTQVPFLLERAGVSRAVPLAFAADDDPKRPGLSRWRIALPHAGLPLTRLTLVSPTALFQRRFRLFERIADNRAGSYERTLAEAEWSRTPGRQQPLVLPLVDAASTDTVFLETDNGDNPAIVLTSVSAAVPVARLFFRTDAGPLALYYGNPGATAPRYDLSLVAGQILAAEKNPATLDPEVTARQAGWGASLLGGARSGIVFWGVLALVVATLLVVVARLLPKPPPAP